MELVFPENEFEIFSPPGTLKIADNFYCDQTEITNISWKEYKHWTKRKFGETSKEYKTCLPDTTVFNNVSSFGEPYLPNYFTHPAYNNYPVVGVSKQQIENYTQWRTNRVIEVLLIGSGFITSEQLDSIDISNFLERPEVKEKIKMVPVYRLPTKVEFDEILTLYNFTFETALVGMQSTDFSKKQREALAGLHSNANEIFTDTVIGNYPFAFPENFIILNRKAEINAWTSFRNVCSWGTLEEYLEMFE